MVSFFCIIATAGPDKEDDEMWDFDWDVQKDDPIVAELKASLEALGEDKK